MVIMSLRVIIQSQYKPRLTIVLYVHIAFNGFKNSHSKPRGFYLVSKHETVIKLKMKSFILFIEYVI